MMRFVAVFAVICSSLAASAQALEVGAQAPRLEFSTSLNSGLTKDSIAGKTVVLEFWATWCAPCIAGFPHLNELSEEFASQEVLFLSITKEKEIDKVKKLLAQRPLKAHNLLDDEGKTNANYKARSIPKTVVIGKDGTLLWDGYYSELTKELLAKIIREQEPVKQEKRAFNPAPKDAKAERTGFQLKVSYSENQDSVEYGERLSMNPGGSGFYEWTANRWSFINFFGLQLNGLHRSRIICDHGDFNIDLNYYCDTNFRGPDKILMESLAAVFDFGYSFETKAAECWVLKVEDADKLQKAYNKSIRSSSVMTEDSWIFRAGSLPSVAKQLERFGNEIVVVDASVGDGTYDIDFPVSSWQAAQEHLFQEYGLTLEREERPVEMLVLSFGEKPEGKIARKEK